MKITIKNIQEFPEKFYQMLVESQAELASYKLKYVNLLEEIRLAKQHRFSPHQKKIFCNLIYLMKQVLNYQKK